MPVVVGQCRGELSCPSAVRAECRVGLNPSALRGEMGGGGGDASRGSPRPVSHDEPSPAKLAFLEAAGWCIIRQTVPTERMTAGTLANTVVSSQGADINFRLALCGWLR